MYIVYWLIAENRFKTYLGFTSDLENRLKKHRTKQVKSTKDFGEFKCFIIEKAINIVQARKREKYWKSCIGRKKLEKVFKKYFNPGPIV
ncbi:GIY-YIG nuclease family protein [Candidatus Parcubacteria bacterium]|nr:MAG: GIY-YIG nuclease family protein [Candidatus Parcubacteria bacterium]